MYSPIETQLTEIFQQLNPHAYAILTTKAKSRQKTNKNSILVNNRQYSIWYSTDPNDLYQNQIRAIKVGDLKPHSITLCIDRLPLNIQMKMLKVLNRFVNKSLHDQLTDLNIKS